MDYVYDLPEDARPDCTYGTPEFEAKRLSRWELPKRHVKPVGPVVPTDAKAMLARYAEIRRSFRTRVGKPDPGPDIPAITRGIQEKHKFNYKPRRSHEVALYDFCHTTCPTLYPDRFGPPSPMRRICRADVVRVVVLYYESRLDELLGESRKARIVRPRQIAMYLVHQVLGLSFPEIGRFFGGRDHTTALHAVRKIAAQIEEDEALANDIAQMKHALGRAT